MIIAERSTICRTTGVLAEKNSSSHFVVASILNRYVECSFTSLAADFTGPFVRVPVDRRGAGIHPDARRALKIVNRAAQQFRGNDARVHDCPAIRVVISAVDIAARKI
jgi:hypothetical protein